jgi:hypothetical protein
MNAFVNFWQFLAYFFLERTEQVSEDEKKQEDNKDDNNNKCK